MKRHKAESVGFYIPICVILLVCISSIDALRLTKTDKTFAKYPTWNACINGTFSFDFKTNRSNGILMYTDDNGRFDYVEVQLVNAAVRLRMNIVDGKDGSIQITMGTNLNDNRWHTVEIQRNRMATTLYVDGESLSQLAFGSDFNFGEISRNNFVFFGGLPKSYLEDLKSLSLPSVLFDTRFEGEIRNVIYGNCSCRPVRGDMIEGESVSRDPPEACERENPCGNCLCYSQDDGPGCQCVTRECATDTLTYYHLPMDAVENGTIRNPSGLDAKVSESSAPVPGVVGGALKIDGRQEQVTVSGSGHRYECFGDLGLCPNGYTLAMWLKFENTGSSEGVYLSNGGQSSESHGVAMLYKTGTIMFIFRMKDGKEWRVNADDILPRRWYHVTTTWKVADGLALYINGEKVSEEISHSYRVNPSSQNIYNDFVIGRSNNEAGRQNLGIMYIDEFQFWSTKKTAAELRENGAVYRYHITMDDMRRGQLVVPNLEPRTIGNVRQVPGKIGKAISLQGSGEHVDLGYFGDSCLGNTTLCMYGFMVSMWISFPRLLDNGYYIASGVSGFNMLSYRNRLYATVQKEDRRWQASIANVVRGRWYFIEISWNQHDGLRIYLDQELKATSPRDTYQALRSSASKNFYLGRANANMVLYQKYGVAVIDELEMFNADRDTLLFLDFIQRGKPKMHHYGLDRMIGSRILHSTTLIQTSGSPVLVPGKVGNALYLNGRNQLAEFDNSDDCLGNLDYCRHGVLLALWFKPDEFVEGMHYLSSAINGLTLSYVDSRLRASAMTTTRKWEVMTPVLTANKWYYLEVSWDPDTGMKMYSNNQFLNEDKEPKENPESPDSSPFQDNKFYLGRLNGNKRGSLFGAATYDEMEYWYGPRGYLLAFGYLQRGKPRSYRISMDEITDAGQRLAHPSLPITLRGYPTLVPGRVGNALKMNGVVQTMSLGDQTDKCLGNLRLCTHGITISAWMRIDDYDTNMFILSTGREGIRMYYNSGYIYLTVNSLGKSWRASMPQLNEGEWHYVELSWHSDFGLNFYLDNELQDNAGFINVPTDSVIGTNDFIIGGPNSGDIPGQRFSYSNMAIDELEVWYGRREELLAFDYIVRDHVGYESFSMETVRNGVVYHPHFTITLERGATLVNGKIGKAVSLNGRGQFVDLGQHMDKCLANLDRCNHGITMSMWLNAGALQDNTYFLSSPTYSLFYKDGQLQSQFTSAGKAWNVATTKFKRNTWHKVMLSWEPEDGLVMYLDDDVVSSNSDPTSLPQGDQPQEGGSLYIGKTSDSSDTTNPRTANALVDEVQYWYADIQKLQNHNLLGGKLYESFLLSQIDSSGVMRLPDRTIVLKGNPSRVRGQHSEAIKLNGKGQFIDLGDNLTCGGNLDLCQRGFTMRFPVKPEKLSNNMYFVDSFPVSVFYRDGKLYTTVRSPSKSWTVAAPGFRSGQWQMVDVTWHPETGLTMFIDGEEVGAHKTHGTEHELKTTWETKSYIGRALGDMQNERYANAIFENFEVWNVRRDVIYSNNRQPDIDESGSQPTAPPSIIPPLITERPITVAPNDGRDVTVDSGVIASGALPALLGLLLIFSSEWQTLLIFV